MNIQAYNNKVKLLESRIEKDKDTLKELQTFVCKSPKETIYKEHKFIKDMFGKYCSECGFVLEKADPSKCAMCEQPKENLVLVEHPKGKVLICSECKASTIVLHS